MSAGRVLGYVVAPQPGPGMPLLIDWHGEPAPTPLQALAECGEPGDVVLAVCEVTP